MFCFRSFFCKIAVIQHLPRAIFVCFTWDLRSETLSHIFYHKNLLISKNRMQRLLWSINRNIFVQFCLQCTHLTPVIMYLVFLIKFFGIPLNWGTIEIKCIKTWKMILWLILLASIKKSSGSKTFLDFESRFCKLQY